MSRSKLIPGTIHGSVAPGFEGVRTEFERNFRERGELGGACAAYHKGRKVVDLWGGHRDQKTRAPWKEDTLVVVFSTTKGLASMAVAVAHSHRMLDYEENVAAYWPEFAQQGKAKITVRQLMSHQAGLSVIEDPLNARTIANPEALAAVLARQKPAWEPGTKHAYHALSLGWYEGELIRRVDPQHRTLGKFFQDEVARPLGLEFYIGLPAEIPDSRIATLKFPKWIEIVFKATELEKPFFRALRNPESLTSRALSNPKDMDAKSRAFLALENPASTGIGQVRSIARAYGAFSTGGSKLGIRKETLEALTSPASGPPGGFYDEVLHAEVCYSLGFLKPFGRFQFGSSDRSFGTPGAGGSFGYADPDAQVGFAYASNKLGIRLFNDPREKPLRDALYGCLRELGETAGTKSEPLKEAREG